MNEAPVAMNMDDMSKLSKALDRPCDSFSSLLHHVGSLDTFGHDFGVKKYMIP